MAERLVITEGETKLNREAAERLAEADAEWIALKGLAGTFRLSPAYVENRAAKDWLIEYHPDLVIDPEDRRSYPQIASDLGRIATGQ